MHSFSFLFLLFAFSSSVVFGGPIHYAWDKPLFEQTHDTGPSTFIDDKSRHGSLTCQVYPEFTLFIQSDPGLKGTTFRTRKNRNPIHAGGECALNKGEKLNEFTAGSFRGAIQTTLILDDSGRLGDEGVLVLVDALTGRRLLTADYDIGQGVELKKVGSRVQMTYSAYLPEPRDVCDLTNDKGGACLLKTLEAHQVSDPARFKRVTCGEKKSQYGFGLFLDARVDNLRQPVPRFVGENLRCIWVQ